MRKLARPGRPRSRSASSPRTSASASGTCRRSGRVRATSASSARAWPACQASAGVVAVSASRAAVSPVTHAASGRSPDRSASAAPSRSTNSARRPSRSTSPDSTSSSGSAVPSQLLALHRDAEQQPVQPRGPGVLREPVEPVRAAVRGRQPPPDPGTGDEVAQPVQVVAVEAEAAADRARGEQVEHLGRREPGVGELQQAPGDVEQRVHLPQRTVGEPDRQPVAGVAGSTLGIEPERRRHQRSEGLDVRAGDEDVARLQRRVGGEQAEHDLAEHLDLAVRAVAGVHRRPTGRPGRARGRPRAPGRRARRVAGAAAASPAASSAPGWCVSTPGRPASRSCSSRTSRPSAASSGWRGELGGGIGAARGHAHGHRRDAVPQGGGGVRQPQVHVAVAGEGGEHGQVVRGQAGGAEQRQPLRQGAARGVALAARRPPWRAAPRGSGTPIRARRRPPQLRLPAQVRGHVRVVARAPGVEQLGPVGGVGVEQARRGARPRRTGCAPAPGGRPAGRTTAGPRRCRRPPGAATPPGRGATGRRRRTTPVAPSTAAATTSPGAGKATCAHTPSPRPDAVPSRCARRCASQRSIPRAGTATTSAVNGSAGGSARTSASASARVSARSARCRCSTASPTVRDGAGFAAPSSGRALPRCSVLTFHAVQPRASPRRLRAVRGARRAVVHKPTATCGDRPPGFPHDRAILAPNG